MTIEDNDPAPYIYVADATVDESADTISFTVSLMDMDASGPAPSAFEIGVDYETGDATTEDMYDMATAGADYVAASDTLTFAPGEVEKVIVVAVNDADLLDEHDEMFTVTLSNATSTGPDPVTIGDAEATGTITDDDDPPSLTIADMTVGESDGEVTFTAMLDAPSGLPIVLDYETGDASVEDMYDMATADVDYTSGSGMIDFTPAEPGGPTPTEATITVAVLPDAMDEHDEMFSVSLTAQMPEYLTALDDMAIGTITDDDDPPTLTIADASADESAGMLDFVVSLDGERRPADRARRGYRRRGNPGRPVGHGDSHGRPRGLHPDQRRLARVHARRERRRRSGLADDLGGRDERWLRRARRGDGRDR